MSGLEVGGHLVHIAEQVIGYAHVTPHSSPSEVNGPALCYLMNFSPSSFDSRIPISPALFSRENMWPLAEV